MEKGAALPKNIRQIGEISGKEKICIEDYVMTYIRKREPQEDKGCLGIFLGEQQETEDSTYVFIRGIFEMPEEFQEPQEQEKLRLECETLFGDWSVQGCCVIGAYPTERMKALAAWLPEAGKLIYHLQEQEETLYWTGEEQYRRLPGYFVFYEQNRKMQEYLAEVFRDSSVEKESLPDRAIRSFREKVKEKGEQKQMSFLRMASSFFVIAILIVGAIVVNRIEDVRMVRSLPSDGGGTAAYQLQGVDETMSGTAASGAASLQSAGQNADQVADQNSEQDAIQPAEQNAVQNADQNSEQDVIQSSGQNAVQADGENAEQSEAQQSAGQNTALSTEQNSGKDAVQPEAQQSAGQNTVLSAEQNSEEGAERSEVQQSAGQNTALSTEQNSGKNTVQSEKQSGDAAETAALYGAAAGTAQYNAIQKAAEEAELAGPDAFWEESDLEDSAETSLGAEGAQDGAADPSASSAPSEPEASQEAAARHTQAGYVIKEGDTLAKICSWYYGTIDQIGAVCEANGIEDANVIMPGQRIVLP